MRQAKAPYLLALGLVLSGCASPRNGVDVPHHPAEPASTTSPSAGSVSPCQGRTTCELPTVKLARIERHQGFVLSPPVRDHAVPASRVVDHGYVKGHVTQTILATLRGWMSDAAPRLVWVFRVQNACIASSGPVGGYVHQTMDQVFDARTGRWVFGGTDGIWPVYARGAGGYVPYIGPEVSCR
jgi:hypothetical protein